MKVLKIISWVVKALILLLLLVLAFINTQKVNFSYLPGQSVDMPLIVILFGAFVVGTVFGIFAMFGRLLRLRGECGRLRHEVRKTARLTTQDLSAPAGQSAPNK
ncbi:MAG: lipopolysaccharide assembly protein LapA domain-containing protein [Conchiformibius sp.]|nr:lipopolysaccharide assembly protein LapA domain-containing protein [Conchiformibius sp.]